MEKQWDLRSRGKKVYTLIGDVTTQMRFAVLGDKERFLKHKHAWKAWQILKDFGCIVFPIAKELPKLEGVKVYADIGMLTDKIDVVVPCLRIVEITSLLEQCKTAGVKVIWFQEGNWKDEFQAQCDEVGINTVRGCILKHKIYPKPFCYFNPCYWHGIGSTKVPKRR